MLLRLALVAGFAFAAANAGVLWWARTQRPVDAPVDVQSRGLFEARLDAFWARTEGTPRAVFVGDSIVFGEKLAQAHGDAWPERALPARFEAAAGGRFAVLNLGINGLLFDDLTCVVDEVLRRRPELLAIHVSPRPFAREFATTGAARPFLCETGTPLAGALPVLRWRDPLQWRLFGGPTREAAASAVRRWTAPPPPPPEEPEDAEDAALLADAMWRIQAAQRFNDIEVSDAHPQADHLRALFARLGAATRTRVLVFYVGEDVDAVAQQLDRPRFEAQRRRFVERVEALAAGLDHVRFVAIPNESLKGEYSDHVHLTAAGYERLAARLRAEVDAAGGLGARH